MCVLGECTIPVPPNRVEAQARVQEGHSTPGARWCSSRSGRARPRVTGLVCGCTSGLEAARVRGGRPAYPPANLPSCGRVCGRLWVGTPGASSSAQAWGAFGTRSSSAGLRAASPGVCPHGREAAPFVRVTEPCLRAVQWPRQRRRHEAGSVHLERRRPLPTGKVVPPLKKPAPHCSRAAAPEGRGRPFRRGEEEATVHLLPGGGTRGLVLSRDPAGARQEAVVLADTGPD